MQMQGDRRPFSLLVEVQLLKLGQLLKLLLVSSL
uniref:Uncharacterized protein n=2 Tax=Picea TaxID=3328 RepID=A0A124GMY4_PICGL|nr:hypothetical protein ABT39_MTgene6097 [Picea glauca]QHR89939.1 hypothetical protein Q903MT_gene3961 [Picea sitchensis]